VCVQQCAALALRVGPTDRGRSGGHDQVCVGVKACLHAPSEEGRIHARRALSGARENFMQGAPRQVREVAAAGVAAAVADEALNARPPRPFAFASHE
jgi:hypothetical protein